MEWMLPYTLKQKRFWLFYYKFEIIFEETIIYYIIGGFSYIDEAKKILAMCNAAYNLGYSQKNMEIEYGQKKDMWMSEVTRVGGFVHDSKVFDVKLRP